MPARTVKIRHDEQTRAKIQAAQIINRFQKCLNGDIELTTQQVSCGKALLNKVLPDLKATEHSGAIGMVTNPDNLTDDQLAAIATGSGENTPKA